MVLNTGLEWGLATSSDVRSLLILLFPLDSKDINLLFAMQAHRSIIQIKKNKPNLAKIEPIQEIYHPR